MFEVLGDSFARTNIFGLLKQLFSLAAGWFILWTEIQKKRLKKRWEKKNSAAAIVVTSPRICSSNLWGK